MWVFAIALLVCVSAYALPIVPAPSRPVDPAEAAEIRRKADEYSNQGAYSALLAFLHDVEKKYGTLQLDNKPPSLYSYEGISYHSMHRQEDAVVSFEKATLAYPNDSRAWINLGEQRSQIFRLNEAVDAYEVARKIGDPAVLPRLLRVMTWAGIWKDFEAIAADIESYAKDCARFDAILCTLLCSSFCLCEGIPRSIV